MPEWEIHQLETPESLQGIEELQDVIWPGSKYEIVPIHMLLAAIHNGGLVLGAILENQLIGILFGFAGLYSSNGIMNLKHCTYMLAIHPDWRSSALGFALKCAQRQHVLSQGLNLITWTYDPLLSWDAKLNITKLGGICNTYLRSDEGLMFDDSNAGLDSDRLLVNWWLNTCRVEKSLNDYSEKSTRLDDLLHGNVEILTVPEDNLPPNGLPELNQALLLFEIPNNFQALKANDIQLAAAWRLKSREIFEYVFANEYFITDFLVENGHNYYIFENSSTRNIVCGR